MHTSRRTLLLVFAGVGVAAAALAVVLVLVSRGGGSSATTTTAPATRTALLAGIPQRGIELGNPKAPPLYEYADLQCPYCGEFSNHVLPSVIRAYVRTGKVKLVFHGMAFVGPDSLKALRAAEAAGLQNRLWDVLDALYAHQGTENTGWVSDRLLQQIGGSIQGLDREKWLQDAGGATVLQRINDAGTAAQVAGINSTPTFVFAGKQLRLQSLDPAEFKAALDPLLGE